MTRRAESAAAPHVHLHCKCGRKITTTDFVRGICRSCGIMLPAR